MCIRDSCLSEQVSDLFPKEERKILSRDKYIVGSLIFTPEGDGYHHAIELQEQINNFNKGIFVDGSEMKVTASPFSYGVAC